MPIVQTCLVCALNGDARIPVGSDVHLECVSCDRLNIIFTVATSLLVLELNHKGYV